MLTGIISGSGGVLQKYWIIRPKGRNPIVCCLINYSA